MILNKLYCKSIHYRLSGVYLSNFTLNQVFKFLIYHFIYSLCLIFNLILVINYNTANIQQMNLLKVYSETFSKIYSVDEAEFIGSGAYAQVYKIFEPKINKFVAIRKVTKTPEVMQDIEKEITISELLRTVRSEQILEIFDIVEQANYIWYVTQYCEGGSLWQTLANSPQLKFSQTDSLKVALEIAKGVQELHSKRITHRDLKPQNILFSEHFKSGKEPKLKIADFGLSTCNIIMETVAGTKQYLAPEQAKFNTYTNAVDVWSLGIMMDEMLHGTLFYTGQTNKEVFDKILKLDYEVRDVNLSEQTKQLLLRILKKKAYERPIIASIIKSIQQILSTQTKQQKIGVIDRIFQRRKNSESQTKNQTESSKTGFYLRRNQKSRQRPKSKHELTQKLKKAQNSISFSQIQKSILQQKRSLQRLKLNKLRLIFNPFITFKQIQIGNPIKKQIQQILPTFGYLNTFSPNDETYISKIRGTGQVVFQELLKIAKISKKSREQFHNKIMQYLDEYVEQSIESLSL